MILPLRYNEKASRGESASRSMISPSLWCSSPSARQESSGPSPCSRWALRGKAIFSTTSPPWWSFTKKYCQMTQNADHVEFSTRTSPISLRVTEIRYIEGSILYHLGVSGF